MSAKKVRQQETSKPLAAFYRRTSVLKTVFGVRSGPEERRAAAQEERTTEERSAEERSAGEERASAEGRAAQDAEVNA